MTMPIDSNQLANRAASIAAPLAWSNPTRGLERRQGLAAVLADLPVDLTRRKAGSIEKDLHFKLCGCTGPSRWNRAVGCDRRMCAKKDRRACDKIRQGLECECHSASGSENVTATGS